MAGGRPEIREITRSDATRVRRKRSVRGRTGLRSSACRARTRFVTLSGRPHRHARARRRWTRAGDRARRWPTRVSTGVEAAGIDDAVGSGHIPTRESPETRRRTLSASCALGTSQSTNLARRGALRAAAGGLASRCGAAAPRCGRECVVIRRAAARCASARSSARGAFAQGVRRRRRDAASLSGDKLIAHKWHAPRELPRRHRAPVPARGHVDAVVAARVEVPSATNAADGRETHDPVLLRGERRAHVGAPAKRAPRSPRRPPLDTTRTFFGRSFARGPSARGADTESRLASTSVSSSSRGRVADARPRNRREGVIASPSPIDGDEATIAPVLARPSARRTAHVAARARAPARLRLWDPRRRHHARARGLRRGARIGGRRGRRPAHVLRPARGEGSDAACGSMRAAVACSPPDASTARLLRLRDVQKVGATDHRRDARTCVSEDRSAERARLRGSRARRGRMRGEDVRAGSSSALVMRGRARRRGADGASFAAARAAKPPRLGRRRRRRRAGRMDRGASPACTSGLVLVRPSPGFPKRSAADPFLRTSTWSGKTSPALARRRTRSGSGARGSSRLAFGVRPTVDRVRVWDRQRPSRNAPCRARRVSPSRERRRPRLRRGRRAAALALVVREGDVLGRFLRRRAPRQSSRPRRCGGAARNRSRAPTCCPPAQRRAAARPATRGAERLLGAALRAGARKAAGRRDLSPERRASVLARLRGRRPDAALRAAVVRRGLALAPEVYTGGADRHVLLMSPRRQDAAACRRRRSRRRRRRGFRRASRAARARGTASSAAGFRGLRRRARAARRLRLRASRRLGARADAWSEDTAVDPARRRAGAVRGDTEDAERRARARTNESPSLYHVARRVEPSSRSIIQVVGPHGVLWCIITTRVGRRQRTAPFRRARRRHVPVDRTTRRDMSSLASVTARAASLPRARTAVRGRGPVRAAPTPVRTARCARTPVGVVHASPPRDDRGGARHGGGALLARGADLYAARPRARSRCARWSRRKARRQDPAEVLDASDGVWEVFGGRT